MHAVSRRSALLGSPYCRAVRDFLDKWLPLHPNFDAFCIDHFTKIARQFGAGWDLLSKQNLLINTIPSEQLLTALRLHAVKEPNALGELTEIQRLLSPEEQQRQALSAQLDQLCEAKAQLLSQGLVNTELDEKIRNLKRLFRRTPQLQDGEILGERYKLLSLLGRGGFARVYQAFDLQTKSLVAVKVLHSESSDDPRRLARFERGARQMEQLNHPHIVRVLTGPAEHDGFHYFVMECLSGDDLAKAIKESALDSMDKLQVLIEVGAALRFAHQRNLIHRDVKPENILLNSNHQAKLTDFDLVWAADTTGGTQSKAGFGTYLYAAPEQLTDAGKVTTSVDVYGLAMLAIFLLIGRIPIWFREYRQQFIYTLPISHDAQKMLDHCTHSEPSYRPTLSDLIRSLATNWPLDRPSQSDQRKQLIQQHEHNENSYKITIIDLFKTSKPPSFSPSQISTIRYVDLSKADQAQANHPSFSPETTLDPVEQQESNPTKRNHVPFAMIVTIPLLLAGYFLIDWFFISYKENSNISTLLQDIDLDIRDAWWSNAIDKSDVALRNKFLSASTRSDIEQKRQKALDEQRFSTLYEQIELAFYQSNVDEVIKTAKEIPAHSIYFIRAQSKHKQALPTFIQNHIQAATVARKQNNCTEFTRQLQLILDIIPHYESALAEKAKECKPPDVMNSENQNHSKKKRPKPQQGETTITTSSHQAKIQQNPDTEHVLINAQLEFVNGNYNKAISLANSVADQSTNRAWRIIGAAACREKDIKLVSKSYQALDNAARQYLIYVCQREGIVQVGNSFKIEGQS